MSITDGWLEVCIKCEHGFGRAFVEEQRKKTNDMKRMIEDQLSGKSSSLWTRARWMYILKLLWTELKRG